MISNIKLINRFSSRSPQSLFLVHHYPFSNNSNIKINNNKRYLSSSTMNTTTIDKPFTVIGIETSCDDTSVGIVDSSGKILGEYKVSQWNLHKVHNGIVPTIASKAHKEVIDQVVEGALENASMKIEDVDVIAVTVGPGMAHSLEVGVKKASQLAIKYKKPFCSVNHLEGHSLVARLNQPHIEFPFFTILISGGHTQLLICHGVSNYTLLGTTCDDSIGEALDKAARIIDCRFGEVFDGEKIISNIHGGQAIEILAEKGNPSIYPFNVPMLNSGNCDFSFSGLKSELQRRVGKIKQTNTADERPLTLQEQQDFAASFQECAFKHLENKVTRALNWYYNKPMGSKKTKAAIAKKNKLKEQDEQQQPETIEKAPLKGIVVSGGVAQNQKLRKQLESISKKFRLPLYFPPTSLCTDNGTMIAWAGVEMYRNKMTSNPETVFYIPVWPLDKNNNQNQFFKSTLKEKEQEIRKGWYNNVVNMFNKNDGDVNNKKDE
ncbi:hypothetical protein CYY_003945 [Polysphondylium violaceum]|uniref:N(6)-L-threonylcarbamoyladenine synthase n=1 Tax=Polysphondylium violaceum TaxID=133409 RepID=A0A8J4PY77_9MYCE|nr:hypothetical protein CYY_003945 [Polysphondylium violaceum]